MPTWLGTWGWGPLLPFAAGGIKLHHPGHRDFSAGADVRVPRQLDLAEPMGPGQTCSSASCGWLCLLFFEVGLQLGDFKKETKTCKQTEINKQHPQRPQPLRGAWSPNSRAWESDPHWTVTLTSDCEERNHVAMKRVLDDQNHHVGATEASLFLSLIWPSLMPPRSPVLL